MQRGWWTLTIEGVEHLTDADREHIAELIVNGYTAGEVIQQDEYVVQIMGDADWVDDPMDLDRYEGKLDAIQAAARLWWDSGRPGFFSPFARRVAKVLDDGGRMAVADPIDVQGYFPADDDTEAPLVWESAGTDEPGDQHSESGIGDHSYWSLGPDGRGGWTVELIARDDELNELPMEGVRFEVFADEADAKAAAAKYEAEEGGLVVPTVRCDWCRFEGTSEQVSTHAARAHDEHEGMVP